MPLKNKNDHRGRRNAQFLSISLVDAMKSRNVKLFTCELKMW